MNYFDSIAHEVIAIKKTDLAEIQAFLLEKSIDFAVVSADNAYLLRDMANELEYESSEATWDNSGCEY